MSASPRCCPQCWDCEWLRAASGSAGRCGALEAAPPDRSPNGVSPARQAFSVPAAPLAHAMAPHAIEGMRYLTLIPPKPF